MNKKLLFLVLIGVLIIGFVIMNIRGNSTLVNQTDEPNLAAAGDPLDAVSSFYGDWFEARTSTTTDPYTLGLPADERLSQSVQEYISQADRNSEKDPVLCLTNLPPRIGSLPVFNVNGSAQYLVVARGIGGVTPDRAVVDLAVVGDKWLINKIECISGESAPEREFAFERTGYLLKHNEPPLDPNTWYIVFEENGEDGHIAPLFFSETSLCINAGREESVCQPDNFTNAIQATVKGGMSEAGVEVQRIEYGN